MSEAQLAQLRERIVDIVHDAIGSARAHINVAIHELPATRIVEAGQTAAVRTPAPA
jgi:phenylpyruvate tautomerase PptA (4-oxalocrotonate tautomerase family)